MRRRSSLAAFFLVLSAGLSVGCTDAKTVLDPATEGVLQLSAVSSSKGGNSQARVVITPKQIVLARIGDAAALTVQLYDRQGSVTSGKVSWTSLSAEVAQVTSAGVVTGVAQGVALIVAKSGSMVDTATVTVALQTEPVASIIVNPAAATLDALGASKPLAAVAHATDGSTIPGVPMSWKSLNTGVASVDPMGVVTAKSVGTALVVVSTLCCNHADTVPVYVRQIVTTVKVAPATVTVAKGSSANLSATAADALGNPVPGTTPTWSSSHPTIASVDANGVVVGKVSGTATISVTTAGTTSSALVTVAEATSAPITSGFAAPDIASANFDNASLAPFATAFREFVYLGEDPTGKLSGKVAHLRFLRSSTAESPDVNQAVWYNHAAGIGLGQTVFLRGDVLIPTPALNMRAAMRKLMYVMRDPNDASFAVIKAEANVLKAEITGHRVFTGGTIPFDTRVTLEVQITANSALGKADGTFRLWKDGVLVAEATDVIWLTSATPFTVFAFGHQTQHERNDMSVLYDEMRYWDRLAISTKRIGM